MVRLTCGFILPLTLWVIALAGLAIAAIHSWVSTAAENAYALQRKVHSQLTMANVENELVYALGARPLGYRGIEMGNNIKETDTSDILSFMSAPTESTYHVKLDGQPYTLESDPDYVVQIYDSRGLLNLNTASTPILQRFLSFFHAPDTLKNQLPDTLEDWVDEDDLSRIAGAEKTDYERLRRRPPSNARLMSPYEAQSILGWDKIIEAWKQDIERPLFTSCPVMGFNPNTASEVTLFSYIPGMTLETADYVLQLRKETPFRTTRDFTSASGTIAPGEIFYMSMVPATCIIVDLTDRTTNERTRFSLSLSRTIVGRPWQVNYAFKIPSRLQREPDEHYPSDTFPAPETIFAGIEGNN